MEQVDDELISEFLVEAREIVMEVEVTLMELERQRIHDGVVDNEGLNAAFRGFHTVKGVSGFFSFEKMVSAAHEAENLLDQLRSGKLTLREDHITGLCEALDLLTTALDNLESTKAPGITEAQVAALTVRLKSLTVEEPPDAASALPSPPAEPAQDGPPRPPPEGHHETSAEPAATVPATNAPDPEPAAPEPDTEPEPAPSLKSVPEPRAAPEPDKAPAAPKSQGVQRSEEGRSIRVDLRKLDQLMNLVGELIIAENEIAHQNKVTFGEQRASQQLDRVTRNLQHVAMSMRMVPIRTLFRKMVRVVRDVARRQGKEVRVELLGEETEVDKTVVEAIGDPLVHLVRNAVDHGVENQEARIAKGKPPVGTVTLQARHESGEVRVSIADDGNGLDLGRIRDKAVRKGLIAEDAVLDAPQVRELVFSPGFSTAQAVTNISGRGVGMDVVKRNVESVRGRVEVDSAPGEGTTFTLRLPLTLAIIEGMMMRLGKQVFTVPLLAIRESVSVVEYSRIQLPSGSEVVDLRGTMVPLLPMQSLVPYPVAEASGLTRPILVVIEEDGKRAGILADELIGQRQVVIKPIPGYVSGIPGLTGCSILGDGAISLILDVKYLLASVREPSTEDRPEALS